jgi:hypothetical protein
VTPADRASRIALFYGVAPHFSRALRALRERHPGGHLTALLPPGFELTDEERALIDEVEPTERAHYTPMAVGPCLRLVRRIRRARYDAFAVLSDSTQLRILAAMSGARTRLCCHPHGRIDALRGTIPGIVARSVARRALGAVVYALLWLVVRVFPTQPAR